MQARLVCRLVQHTVLRCSCLIPVHGQGGLTHAKHVSRGLRHLVQHAGSALQLLGAQCQVPLWLVHAALLDSPAVLASAWPAPALCLPALLAHPACHTAAGQDSC